MSPVVGVVSTAALDTAAGGIDLLEAQMDATHSAVHAVASAVLPPTNDSASATATAQQLTNVNEFSAAFRLGLAELRKAGSVVKAANAAHQINDAASAARMASL